MPPFKFKCGNCGKAYHTRQRCREPITSCGIICIKIRDPGLRELFRKNFSDITENATCLDIRSFNTTQYKNIGKICKYSQEIEFLMVQRRQSYSFIEIMRGNYDPSNAGMMLTMFKDMSRDEIDLIIGSGGDYSAFMGLECTHIGSPVSAPLLATRVKFTRLVELLQGYDPTDNPDLEWGFPKGRREHNESNIKCGVREFCEETSYEPDQILTLKHTRDIREVFRGSDNMLYQFIYHLSLLTDMEYDPVINDMNRNEIRSVSWMTLHDIDQLMRNHHHEKKKILVEIYKFVVNVLEHDSAAACVTTGESV